jgi:hypothetical protein
MTDENDELRAILEEWQDPKPGPELDSRMLASYRKTKLWRRSRLPTAFGKPRPAFVLVACSLIAVIGLFYELRVVARKPPTQVLKLETSVMRLAGDPGYVTRLDTRGFLPVTDVNVRIIRKQEGKQ